MLKGAKLVRRSSPDTLGIITADASTVINLNATARARDIARASGFRFLVVDVVQAELDSGRRHGHDDSALLDALLVDEVFELVRLNALGMQLFEELVVGPAIQTLDDGEAATIAYALSANTIAAIDERKATTICLQRYPQLALYSTIDILSQPEVLDQLGRDELSSAVFRALIHGRMRVPPQNLDWAVELIGVERAQACRSLSRFMRTMQSGRKD